MGLIVTKDQVHNATASAPMPAVTNATPLRAPATPDASPIKAQPQILVPACVPAMTAGTVQIEPDWWAPGSLSREWAKAAPGALIPALVAVAVGWVALNQYKVAKAKLNLDLFERRVQLFELLQHFVRARLGSGSQAEIDETRTALHTRGGDFKFLFGREVWLTLEEIEAMDIEQTRTVRAFKDSHQSDLAREENVKAQLACNAWFRVKNTDLPNLFDRYLNFSKWSSR